MNTTNTETAAAKPAREHISKRELARYIKALPPVTAGVTPAERHAAAISKMETAQVRR